MRLTVLFLAILFNFLNSEESPPSLVERSKDPIQRVAGSVHLISGDYIDYAIHQETSNVDSFKVGSSYIDSEGINGSLSYA